MNCSGINGSSNKTNQEIFQQLMEGPVPLWLQIVYFIYVAFIFLFGIPGNLIIVLVYGKSTTKKACDWFILFIGTMDLVVCVLSPLHCIQTELSLQITYVNGVLCGLELLCQLAAMTASCFILTIMSIERYIGVCGIMISKRLTPRMSRNISIACVVIGLGISIYPSFPQFQRDACLHLVIIELENVSNDSYLNLVILVICVGCVAFTYGRVIYTLEKHRKLKQSVLNYSIMSIVNMHISRKDHDTNGRDNMDQSTVEHRDLFEKQRRRNTKSTAKSEPHLTSFTKLKLEKEPGRLGDASSSYNKNHSRGSITSNENDGAELGHSQESVASNENGGAEFGHSQGSVASNENDGVEMELKSSYNFTKQPQSLRTDTSDDIVLNATQCNTCLSKENNGHRIVDTSDITSHSHETCNNQIDGGLENFAAENTESKESFAEDNTKSKESFAEENTESKENFAEDNTESKERGAKTTFQKLQPNYLKNDMNENMNNGDIKHIDCDINSTTRSTSSQPTYDSNSNGSVSEQNGRNPDYFAKRSRVEMQKPKNKLFQKSTMRSRNSQRNKFNQERQVTFMLLSITIVFLTTWLPVWVLYLLAVKAGHVLPSSMATRVVYRYCDKIYLINYISNFFIYFKFNATFRIQTKAVTPKWVRKLCGLCTSCSQNSDS